VREMRVASGHSQDELGGALGVSRQTINSIENGRYLPSLPLAFALAHHFACAIEDLFTIEPEETG